MESPLIGRLGFLQPLDTEGLLAHNMVHTLRGNMIFLSLKGNLFTKQLALQENKDVLLYTMNVFINEPLLDWQKLARKLAKEQGSTEGSFLLSLRKKISQIFLDIFNRIFSTTTN